MVYGMNSDIIWIVLKKWWKTTNKALSDESVFWMVTEKADSMWYYWATLDRFYTYSIFVFAKFVSYVITPMHYN